MNTAGSDIHARQFNPLAGIDEDPITGIAAGALGSYLIKHQISSKKEFITTKQKTLAFQSQG